MSQRETELLTADDFKAWQRVNAAALGEEEQRNQRAVDDYVIRQAIDGIKHGWTLDEIGDAILYRPLCGLRAGVYYTPALLRRSLRTIGWVPPRERAEAD